ncbi:MAG TPA: PVC-type heme-binding CxxCH protein [Bryobacterales bacterium]|nr:PVC-type heme-binding CxxCH protein [Bryobacterales bacterium]
MKNFGFTSLCIATALLALAGCAEKEHTGRYKPLSCEDELKSFKLSDDFHVELFACEPQVFDPVEMVFDENGKIYVAEMLDYPEDPPPGQPARSRIVLLEDTDGDGKIDRRTVFADHVLEVSGMMPWKGGLIVTSAPDILFMKDTDGDGKADVRKVLYTGFALANPEGRITNPRLSVDNWIYTANSGHDARITEPDHPEKPPILVRGTDFRFKPDQDVAEPSSGPTQFGLALNDWGDEFITQNTVHIRNVVLPMQYLRRNQYLEVRAVATDISDHGRPAARLFPLTKPQLWRVQRTELRQQRYDENHLNKTEEVGGYFTAASGGTVYTGDAWPKEYDGNVFTGDVNGNLVHRDIIEPDGVTFRAHRAKDGVEFLASTDIWFRPCNFMNAPDGNLYMTDIYREFIETPESIPEAIKKNMDFWNGIDKGRIWRIVANHPLRKGSLKANLGSLSAAELVEQLANPNGWNRQTAQRLLVDKQDRAAAPLLEAMAAKNDFPQARLRALWTLEGISALTPAVVERALHDSNPRIREHALRLAEELLPKNKNMASAILAMAKDPEPRVQFQLAFTLGNMKDPRVLPELADIATAHGDDHWFRTAILSAPPDNAFPLFATLRSRPKKWVNADFLSELAAIIGAKHDSSELTQVLSTLAGLREADADAWREAGLMGLSRGLKLASVSGLKIPAAEPVLMKFLDTGSEKTQNAAREVAQHFELRAFIAKATKDAGSASLPLGAREAAIRSLRGGKFAEVGPALRKLLDPREPPEIQTAAIDSLASFDDPSISATLLESWKTYGPEVRKQALVALLANSGRAPALLGAIETHQIEASFLDAGARDRLLESPDAAIRQRAEKLLKGDNSDRAKVVGQFHSVAEMNGDAARGKQVFEKNCAKCHMPRRQGGRVGPDLSGIDNKSKEELLTSILNPSAEIAPQFVNYVVVTKDNRMHDGVIVSETPGALTLRGDSEEGDVTILRRNIAEVRASSVSLMPDDFEKQLTKQNLADVIAYLRGGL